jgi:hypothetical protein
MFKEINRLYPGKGSGEIGRAGTARIIVAVAYSFGGLFGVQISL